MPFCEDCGAQLSPGVLFCENCGAKITQSLKEPSADIVDKGIIYTNLKLLSETTGQTAEELTSILNSFISDAGARGTGYTLYDVSSRIPDAGTVQQHVDIIKELVKNKDIKYLFIIGSYNVIPSIVWTNEASDQGSDADVTSDLPYSTLETESPFNNCNYDYDEALRVGRLPNVDFSNYFANLKKGCGNNSTMRTFGLSAEVWQEETKDIYSRIEMNHSVLTSPEISKDSVQPVIPADTNLMLINLHGSRQTPYWYGQRESSYPEAMAPGSLSHVENPYFLAVEACYGAYYEDRTKENSILLANLNEKCISLLGSSRIAFGTPYPPGCCADVICGKFLELLENGETAGDALNQARDTLTGDGPDPEEIKTLAEFSLYGDPSVFMNTPAGAKGGAQKKASGFHNKGIRLRMPDVRGAVKREITTVNEKISSVIEEYVYSHYSEFKNVKPTYYKTIKTGDYNAVFATKSIIGDRIVNVRFVQNGDIKLVIESK